MMTTLRNRKRLVIAAVAIIVIFSLADLALTLGFMYTVGIYETNPIAVALVSFSPWALAAFKVVILGFCSAVLLVARARRSGLVGAALSVVLMTGVMIQWGRGLVMGMPGPEDAPEFPSARWVCLAEH